MTQTEKINSLRQRLKDYTIVNKDGCWIWQKAKMKVGYGKISNGKKWIPTHRASWIAFHGPIPDGMCVLHRCDVRDCANPEHLFLGTKSDNAHDRDKKGRTSRGEDHHKAKLTELQVVEILSNLHKSTNYLADQYGVSAALISRIRHGSAWKHIKRTHLVKSKDTSSNEQEDK